MREGTVCFDRVKIVFTLDSINIRLYKFTKAALFITKKSTGKINFIKNEMFQAKTNRKYSYHYKNEKITYKMILIGDK